MMKIVTFQYLIYAGANQHPCLTGKQLELPASSKSLKFIVLKQKQYLNFRKRKVPCLQEIPGGLPYEMEGNARRLA